MHSLLHSDVRSHRSLIRLLRTACFARALRCAHSFARTAHSFACSALLASLARTAALICSLARSITHSGAHRKEVVFYFAKCVNYSISCHCNQLCDRSSFRHTSVEIITYMIYGTFITKIDFLLCQRLMEYI